MTTIALILLITLMVAALTSAEIDSIWDFGQPTATRERFEVALSDHPDSGDEIRTQIARTLGLDRQFEDAQTLLDSIGPASSPVVRLRRDLELGRLRNSQKDKPGAIPFFESALKAALDEGEDFYAVDAAHMLGIANSGEESLRWNEEAIRLAENSSDPRARKWAGSLLNNTGWTYHDMGNYDAALVKFEAALAFQQEHGDSEKVRIARWCIARTLRSLGRLDDALAIQRELEKGKDDGYVWEEIAEILLAQGEIAASRPYFLRAHVELSQDPWLVANEAARIERLRELGQE
jgi:tetratricopeptide (TPR) repeat protein